MHIIISCIHVDSDFHINECEWPSIFVYEGEFAIVQLINALSDDQHKVTFISSYHLTLGTENGLISGKPGPISIC